MNLELPYERLKGDYYVLDLDLPHLPATLELGGTHYIRNPHLHTSLINNKKLVPELMSRDGSSVRTATDRTNTTIIEAILATKPVLKGFRPEFHMAKKPETEAQTIVILINMDRLDEMNAHIEAALGVTIPARPAHVTAFTLANGKPIGLADQAALEQLSRPLNDTELSELKAQVDLRANFGVEL